ncbi:MAG: class I SAM-dependent methyltransferase [Bacteroidota bacterium]|jgi:hypothetical protein
MSKASLIIPFIKLLISQPSVVLKSLFHTVNKYQAKQRVIKSGWSKGLPQIDLLDFCPDLNETIEPATLLYGTSMPIDFVLLQALVKQYQGHCDFFEIGTWRGESMAVVSPNCSTVTSLSLGNKEMEALGWGGQFLNMQRMFSNKLNNAKHIEGNSRTFDFTTLNKKFDVIFVDGDHSYEGVKNDTEKVYPLLKDEHSVIIWHDYVSNYEHIDYEVFAGIIDGSTPEQRKHIYHISNTYCAIYTRKSYPFKTIEYPSVPDKKFRITISGERI